MSEANNNPATNCQQKGRAVDMGTTNQPSVGAAQWAGLGGSAQWAGLGGSALCYTHQTQLLMTIGAGLLSAAGALLGATISPSIMSQTSRVSPPVTSHQHRLQWTLDILHISCLNPSHSL